MNENPYAPPSEPADVAVGVKSGSRADLRKVAQYQRGIIVCILIYLIAIICQLVMPLELQRVIGIGILVLGVVGTALVLLLAMKVYRTAVGLLLGIVAFVPCIGVFVLLAVNAKATKILRENGMKVGLLGADPSRI